MQPISGVQPQITDFDYAEVGNVPFAVTNLQGAVDWLIAAAKGAPFPVAVRLANAYCVALAESPGPYRDLLSSSGINFPDGFPVVRVMQQITRGEKLAPGRVRGPSLFNKVLDEGRGKGLRHFFLGGSPETLTRLQANVSARYPGVDIVGAYSPPFAPITAGYLDMCAEAVADTSADVVWVGLGTPKQDFVASELATQLSRPVVGIGAAFDFVAGTTPEAPVWMQQTGTEWIFRFASEPRRLGRRYTVGNAVFLGAAWRSFSARF